MWDLTTIEWLLLLLLFTGVWILMVIVVMQYLRGYIIDMKVDADIRMTKVENQLNNTTNSVKRSVNTIEGRIGKTIKSFEDKITGFSASSNEWLSLIKEGAGFIKKIQADAPQATLVQGQSEQQQETITTKEQLMSYKQSLIDELAKVETAEKNLEKE